jgi:hypothetical protein
MTTTPRTTSPTTDESDDADDPGHPVNRRSWLKIAGLGLGSVLVVGGAGVGVRGATNGAFNAGSGDPYALWQSWRSMSGLDRVVAAGVLACNPHNTQPWRIAVGPDTIDIHSDPTRRMPLNDASAREHFGGLGCAVENMVIAAPSAGLTAAVELFPDGTTSELVARIVVSPGGSDRDRELADAIPERHTNRGPYAATTIAQPAMTTLTEQATRIDGAGVAWITDRRSMDALGALYVEATQAIAADDAQSREAFSWFRSDRADIDRYRDGLTLDAQGLSGFTLFAAKVLPAQPRTEGDAFWVSSTRDVHTATAAAYGVITVGDSADRAAQVTGGRLLARLHLAATSLGLGFHHMNQITERIDRDRSAGNVDVFSARWAGILGGPASSGLVSFRIGYPERTAGLSPRRSLDDVVTAWWRRAPGDRWSSRSPTTASAAPTRRRDQPVQSRQRTVASSRSLPLVTRSTRSPSWCTSSRACNPALLASTAGNSWWALLRSSTPSVTSSKRSPGSSCRCCSRNGRPGYSPNGRSISSCSSRTSPSRIRSGNRWPAFTSVVAPVSRSTRNT